MKMSITNTGQRRLSMFLFTFFFLLTVSLSCLAFVRSIQVKGDIPIEELEPLKEKEQILSTFAKYSDALCQYDNAQRNGQVSVNAFAAACNVLSQEMHTLLSKRDTTRLYKDVTAFMRMADQYLASLQKSGDATSSRAKILNQQIALLERENQQLEKQNTLLQTDKKVLESEKTNLERQIGLLMVKKAPASGGGSDSTADCIEQMNKFTTCQTDQLKFTGTVKLFLQDITTKVEDIKHVPAVAQNKKRKEELLAAIQKLEEKLEK